MQTEYHWQCPICGHGGIRGTEGSASNALWRHRTRQHPGEIVPTVRVWGHCADCQSNIGRKLCAKGNEVNAELRPCWSKL